MKNEEIIRVEELSKSFGEHEVLRKIDFEVNRGEVICILDHRAQANQRCYGVLTVLKSRVTEECSFTAKSLANLKRKLTAIVQRWEWFFNPLIYLII